MTTNNRGFFKLRGRKILNVGLADKQQYFLCSSFRVLKFFCGETSLSVVFFDRVENTGFFGCVNQKKMKRVSGKDLASVLPDNRCNLAS